MYCSLVKAARPVLAISIFSLFIFTAQANIRYKNCTPKKAATMHLGMKFLQKNLEKIIKMVPKLNYFEKSRLRSKVKSMLVICRDNHSMCKRESLLGQMRNIFLFSVNICFENHKLYHRAYFCPLVDTLIHEIAHAAKIKMKRNHNDGENGDRVYQVGRAAQKLCRKLSPLATVTKL